ncbi:transmembrane protein 165 [Clonorchis sinensis]|uniref:GDT1 family protein n=1 Tax=Clonorchis sinensis TaxID=79923 RepID=G7Y836_CLOSI|nr:transmembrane protein 165 [Clonorchis sinensis]
MKMIYDGRLTVWVASILSAYQMSPTDTQDEYEEVKLQLAQSNSTDLEMGKTDSSQLSSTRETVRYTMKRIFSPILAEAFILTFLAEWGDRSQLTTIVLAATKSVSGVIVGGILGHAVCTGLAVLVGRFVAQRIPVKWLTYIGGTTFLLFGIFTFLGDPDSNS